METNSKSNESRGILLIGHGISLAHGNIVVYEIAEMYKKMTDYPVEVGFMNVEKPTNPLHLTYWRKKVLLK